ncbi:hypothetical protein B0T17DRAFT_118202 [Bombardia bombarda]|uniref:Uncharacterized protein n=1 Tax=Bombardia bombarda TaxID=252184 RepID=A0AA39T146_9PEZI|nr:hypothetical protein B0T17DRAFT_118202 [Bombardia bombarda]
MGAHCTYTVGTVDGQLYTADGQHTARSPPSGPPALRGVPPALRPPSRMKEPPSHRWRSRPTAQPASKYGVNDRGRRGISTPRRLYTLITEEALCDTLHARPDATCSLPYICSPHVGLDSDQKQCTHHK